MSNPTASELLYLVLRKQDMIILKCLIGFNSRVRENRICVSWSTHQGIKMHAHGNMQIDAFAPS